MVYFYHVWNAITDFLLRAHTAGLGHDAVIEIMIALLGVMIAVLGLLSVLVTLAFAGLGFFGFQIIRDEAVKAAVANAKEIAKTTAKSEANRVIRAQLKKQQATELSTQVRTQRKSLSKKFNDRKTSDSGLRGEEE